MGAWMIEAVGEALDTGNECDITPIFTTEFSASPVKKGGDLRKITSKQIYDHIINHFTIIEDSTDVLRLSIKVA